MKISFSYVENCHSSSVLDASPYAMWYCLQNAKKKSYLYDKEQKGYFRKNNSIHFHISACVPYNNVDCYNRNVNDSRINYLFPQFLYSRLNIIFKCVLGTKLLYRSKRYTPNQVRLIVRRYSLLDVNQQRKQSRPLAGG